MTIPKKTPWRRRLAGRVPANLLNGYRTMRAAWGDWQQRTVITHPTGFLSPTPEKVCALLVVGRAFDQRKPDAMMTCRMGYARAFEKLGVPYRICDWKDLPRLVDQFPRSFALVFGSDVPEMSSDAKRALTKIPSAIWVNPWFEKEHEFFAEHGLSAETWIWSSEHRRSILSLSPRYVFTATVPSGLTFFSRWANEGLSVVSQPLACDTSLYSPQGDPELEFAGVELAFVGGYWESKGRALDQYLRPFEGQLTVYGYNRWPYQGYRGQLSREREPALYRQAKVCPVVNEPTVALLKGQINERIFKVFGCGGVPVVDAVPAYRELFSEQELAIPSNAEEFTIMVNELLLDPDKRRAIAIRGRDAVLSRHTYVHRANEVLARLAVETPSIKITS